ncbi:MAG: right-handed parallel beta-helix repeat-containing protein, partial [Candidatus Saccharibacteria bacterium]
MMKRLHKNRLKGMLLASIIVCFSMMSFGATYYVSNSGNDSNSGLSTALPWQTLNKVNSTNLMPGDQILFQRGNTFYGSLTLNNSGAAGSPITYGAYGTGVNPIITGFANVTSWTNLGNNIWESTNAVSGLSSCNMVTINDVNVPMGRYPNTGYLTFQSHSGQNSITSSSLSGTPNWTGGEVVVRIFKYFLSRAPISSQSGGTLQLSKNLIYEPENGYGFFIQNNPQTLDVQNEWYYNPSTKKLRIYSATTPQNVKIATIQDLVTMHASYITFDNLTLTGANNCGIYNYDANTSYLNIQNSTISFSGNKGVQVWNEHFTMENSVISDSNNAGLDLPAGNSNAIIRNNTIQNSGVFAGMGMDNEYCGINVANNANLIIEYNKIINTGYKAIGWWGSSNVLIKNNFIDTFCKILDDGGGIYTSSASGGRITGNIVLNGIGTEEGTVNPQPSGTGIYCDDYSTGLEIDNNTVSGVYGLGIFLHNTTYTNVHHNIAYDNGKQFATAENLSFGVNNVKVNYNQFIARTATQRCANFFSTSNNLTSMGTMDYNYYARPIDDNLTIAWYQPSIGGSGTLGTFENWRSYMNQELNSHKSPQSVTNLSDFQFEYNGTKTAKTVSLSRPMIDVKGTKYSGSITLQPFTSIVLFRDQTASGDITAPVVTGFSVSATSSSTTVSVTNFTATDNVGVTGYMITETATMPSAGATGWAVTKPTSYVSSSAGSKTLYAWAKDAAGNVSASLQASTTISTTTGDVTAPVVTGFSIPTTSSSLTITISNFTATDNVGVTGYMITETPTKPLAGATGWTTSLTSYVCSSAGSKTLYAWAKDAAGNVSASLQASTTISTTTADVTAPVVTGFSIPATSNSLTVTISNFTATDNVGVTGYMITETATMPSAGATGWAVTKPT